MKQVLLLLLLFLASGLGLSVSQSKSGPQAADESFSVGYIQMKSEANCSYKVVISTSCSSPKFTTDEISIVFGDAHGNQIYAPKLGDPMSRTFERCSSDTFQIDGACLSRISYVYLYRLGASENDVWQPERVKIYGFNIEPITLSFINTSIPNNTWYGYNFYDFPTTPPPPPHFPPFIPTSPPPPFHHSPPPPSPSPPPPPPPPFHHSPPPPSPPPPPPTTPPSPPPSPPPPPPPPSSSYKLFTPNWLIYVVLGYVLSLFV